MCGYVVAFSFTLKVITVRWPVLERNAMNFYSGKTAENRTLIILAPYLCVVKFMLRSFDSLGNAPASAEYRTL
jgi:hypothetical protein